MASNLIRNGRYAGLDPDKLRGGYYTSREVASWLCRWAIRSPEDRVLEPSCGDGVFLEAAAERFHAIDETPNFVKHQIVGVELLRREAEKARVRLSGFLGKNDASSVVQGDFFAWWQEPNRPSFDVVVGNPPFIRYQSFPEPSRSRAMQIMKDLGLTSNGLTNIWVPFVVAATACLRQGGRFALVLPAELLQVSYAAQLRSFLADRFQRIDIVACNDLHFENAEQEVVLALAENALRRPKTDNVCRIALSQAKTVQEIVGNEPAALIARATPKTIRHDSEKWLKYFLTVREIGLMRRLRECANIVPLGTHARVEVGVVTGKNEFFVLNEEQIKRHGLAEFVIPLIARSSHLGGARIAKSEWREMATRGERVYLFYLNGQAKHGLPEACRRYISLGEQQEVHKGYKCSIRTPWYTVPSVWEPQCFLFRQIYDFPRMVLNRAGATSTDTIHRVTCNGKPQAVASNLYTYMTAASAEIEGRSYGGGVLELEPTEAERLLAPRKLADAMPLDDCDRLIRAGRLDDVLAENSRRVLKKGIGLSQGDCAMLKRIWTKMRDRRLRRKRQRVQEREITL